MFKFTFEQLLNAQPKFLNDFESVDDVICEYRVFGYSPYGWESSKDNNDYAVSKFHGKYQILYADYTYEDYSGDSYVLGYDREENKFFEVHGSHCSCYGLEEQWDVEYVEFEELLNLLNNRNFEKEKSWYSRSACSSEESEEWLKIIQNNA